MAATYTLSGNPKTLLGGEDFERIRAYITCDQAILTDPDSDEVRIIGEADLILAGAADTDFSVSLPGNGWTPSPHFYTIHVEGWSRTTGANRVVTTAPFQMTADITLADLPQAAPKAITVQDYESLIEARDEAVAAKESAEEAAAQANAPTDGQVGTSLANRGLPTTGTELSASSDQNRLGSHSVAEGTKGSMSCSGKRPTSAPSMDAVIQVKPGRISEILKCCATIAGMMPPAWWECPPTVGGSN